MPRALQSGALPRVETRNCPPLRLSPHSAMSMATSAPAFAPVAMEGTGETDSSAEQAGCRPSVPLPGFRSRGKGRGSVRTVLKTHPRPRGGTERSYGAGGEEMATSSLHVTDGVPRCPSRTT